MVPVGAGARRGVRCVQDPDRHAGRGATWTVAFACCGAACLCRRPGL